MKANVKKIIMLIIWGALIAFVYNKGLVTTDTGKIKAMMGSSMEGRMAMFVLISVARVLLFIPGVVFMVLGGLCFGPIIGLVLSMLSMVISETIIFIIGRYFAGERLSSYLNEKHKDILTSAEKYGYGFMALGIVCPIAPSDVVCIAGAMLNFRYRKYILTVILANIPLMSIYSYLGNSSLKGTSQNIIMGVVISAVLVYTIFVWLRLKSGSKITDT